VYFLYCRKLPRHLYLLLWKNLFFFPFHAAGYCTIQPVFKEKMYMPSTHPGQPGLTGKCQIANGVNAIYTPAFPRHQANRNQDAWYKPSTVDMEQIPYSSFSAGRNSVIKSQWRGKFKILRKSGAAYRVKKG
jgi:hypothetical protein